MIRCGSVFGPQFVRGRGSSNLAVVCVDSLAALAVSMAIYGHTWPVADGSSADQADGEASTKGGSSHVPGIKNVERMEPTHGLGLRR